MSERSIIKRSARRLPIIRESVDRVFATDKIEAGTGSKVVCEKGCAACCHQLVTVSMPEAVDIYMLGLKDRGIGSAMETVGSKQSQQIMAGETTVSKWFAAGTRCMFLSSSNECRIYDHRPLTCRTHVALDTSENCQVGAPNPKVKRVDTKNVNEASFAFFSKDNWEAQLPVGVIPMPVALSWVSYAWMHGRDALKRKLAKDKIPAYDHIAHPIYWATMVER